MLTLLLRKPVSVLTTLVAVTILSLVAFTSIPISLLPAIDIPQITVDAKLPNATAEEVEFTVLKQARDELITLDNLSAIASNAYDGRGTIQLRFEQGTAMDHAYFEVNEKIDRLMAFVPVKMQRPIVTKSNTADIPILRIQVVERIPPEGVSLSEFSRKVLSRKLSQIRDVSMVDINGVHEEGIRIVVDGQKAAAFGVRQDDIHQSISQSVTRLSSVSLKDGRYLFNVKLDVNLRSARQLSDILLPAHNGASTIRLAEVATVYNEFVPSSGFHLSNSNDAVVLSVYKKPQGRISSLVPEVRKLVEKFRTDYPTLDFQVTQDQSSLVSISIDNLTDSLLSGGLVAFCVLFFFMKDWREPVIMGSILPLSLLISMTGFYLLDVSLNILSLSGLTLGLSMLVDNSIVVIDSIILKRHQGYSIFEACVSGTNEVIVPLLTSATTNVIVFLPLLFVTSLAGTIFIEQAISVAIVLSTSVVCTFLIVPLLYLKLCTHSPSAIDKRKESKVYDWILSLYKRTFDWSWRHKISAFVAIAALVPIGLITFGLLKVETFPKVEQTELVLSIDWGEQIEIDESKARTIKLLDKFSARIADSETDGGPTSFLFAKQNASKDHVDIWIKLRSGQSRQVVDQDLFNFIRNVYPSASFEIKNSMNPFEHVFATGTPPAELRVRDPNTKQTVRIEKLDSLLKILGDKASTAVPSSSFDTELAIFLKPDVLKLSEYAITQTSLINTLSKAFTQDAVSQITTVGQTTPIFINTNVSDINIALNTITVESSSGRYYPLREIVDVSFRDIYKSISADNKGVYHSLTFPESDTIPQITSSAIKLIENFGLSADLSGKVVEPSNTLNGLGLAFCISVILMYVVMLLEFESLVQPIIVILTVPLGISGSLLAICISGGSINVMSSIGLIVVLGVLDNDAILKIDRINHLKKEMSLENAIKKAGEDRLRPIVMNTLTNVLSLVPVLFASGLGADLQRPVAIATIGGLIVGTITALYFVPLVYWALMSGKSAKEPTAGT